MRQYQIIRAEENGEQEVWATSTRKRDIESRFNRMMNSFKDYSNYFVEEMNAGYAIITILEGRSTFRVEYYITAVKI